MTASVQSSPPPPSASSAGEESDAEDDLGGWATEQFGPLVLHVPPPPRGGALPARREGMKVEDLADLDAFLLADGVRERLPTPEPTPQPAPAESWASAVKYEEVGSEDDDDDDSSSSSGGGTDGDDRDEIDFISETFPSPFVPASSSSSSVPLTSAFRRPPRPRTMPASSALLPRRPFLQVKRESSCAPSSSPSSSSSAAAAMLPPLLSTPGWRSSLLAKPSISPLNLSAHVKRPSAACSAAPPSSRAAEWSTPSSSSVPPAYSSSPLVRCAALFESDGRPGPKEQSPSQAHGQSPPPAKRQRLTLEPQGTRSTSLAAAVKVEPASTSPLTVTRGSCRPASRIPVLTALRRTRARPPAPVVLGAVDAALFRTTGREPSPPSLSLRQLPPGASTTRSATAGGISVKAEVSALDVGVLPVVVGPAKRGRGRPRKHPLPPISVAPAPAAVAAASVVDRSRQVKEELLDAASVPVVAAVVVAKRPRGRPRKHPLPVPPPTSDVSSPDDPAPAAPVAPSSMPVKVVNLPTAAPLTADIDEARRQALALELFGPDDDDLPLGDGCGRPPSPPPAAPGLAHLSPSPTAAAAAAADLSEAERDRLAKLALARELFGDEAEADDVLVVAGRPTSPAAAAAAAAVAGTAAATADADADEDAMDGVIVVLDDDDDDPLAGYDVW